MIRPRSRLLFGFALVALPLAVTAAVDPGVLPPLGGLLAAFLLVVLVDARRAGRTLEGVELRIDSPVRLQKGEAGRFMLTFLNPIPRARTLRVMVDFPPALGVDREESLVRLPAQEGASQLEFTCLPVRRGRFTIPLAGLEGASPWGFWDAGKRLPLNTEVRIYPSLLKERKATALFLGRNMLGSRVRRHSGKGREFEQVRDYQPGDPLQDIHWKASAKRRTPMTKTYQIERTQEIVVVIDASRFTMTTDANGQTLLERFITSALVLSLAARQQGDHFGLLAFSDRILRFVSPRGGAGHFQTCRDLLYSLEPTAVSPDFQELATTLRLRLRKRALVMVLTSLSDPATADAFQASIPPLCRQHLLLVNMVRPPLAAPLFSRSNVAAPEHLYEHLAGHLQWRDLRERQKTLQREGVTLSLLDQEKLSVELVSQYMSLKQRQAL